MKLNNGTTIRNSDFLLLSMVTRQDRYCNQQSPRLLRYRSTEITTYWSTVITTLRVHRQAYHTLQIQRDHTLHICGNHTLCESTVFLFFILSDQKQCPIASRLYDLYPFNWWSTRKKLYTEQQRSYFSFQTLKGSIKSTCQSYYPDFKKRSCKHFLVAIQVDSSISLSSSCSFSHK